MKLIVRILGVSLIAVLVFVLAGVIATWAPDRSVAQLSPRWAQAPSQFVSVAGMQVHLRDEGPRNDPNPIVLIHGTASSLHTWDGWAQNLSATRRVIRFDLPAFGLTGPHPQNDYSMAAYVQFVQQVFDVLGVKQVVLGGNSLGGQIAWEFALAQPQRVTQLILVDAGGYPMQSQSVPLGFRLAQIPVLGRLMEYTLPRGVVLSSVRNVYGNPAKVTPALVDRYYELTLRAGNRLALVQRLAQMRWEHVEQIKTLKLPTLVLWGAQDKLIPLDNGRHFAADIAGARLVIFEQLGHVPHEEDAQNTLPAVREFLKII